MQRLQPMKILHFEWKIKIPKNMSKSILQIIYSCSVQTTARKKTKYSRNETILKIGQKWQIKGYSLCKIVTLNQKLKMQKNMLKTFLQHIAVVLCKKQLQKTANIRRKRAFQKWPKMDTMQRLQPMQNTQLGSKNKSA